LTFSFVFPGQGSQSIGMQQELAHRYPIVRETYKEAADNLGFDLWDIVQNGPKERLNQTTVTQPAMLTAGIATWRAWLNEGGDHPKMMAGHSLGEYSALVAAGAIEFGATIKLVRKRAELMQSAVPEGEGGMAAILGLEDEAIIEVCRATSQDGVVEAVNFNSPGQVVVAGERFAVEKVVLLAKEAGARRAIMLPVSVPAHSSLMRLAGAILADELEDTVITDPVVPVICAVDAMPYANPGDIRNRLKQQIFQPVRWVDVVRHMMNAGIENIVECGPGKVLTGLNRRIDRSLTAACLDNDTTLQEIKDGVFG